MKYLFTCLLACLCTFSFAQVSRYAVDLRHGDISSWLGISNPNYGAQEITITGYAADGSLVGTKTLTVDAWSRVEFASADLFEDGTPAWAAVSAERMIASYVRYKSGEHFSMTPLSENMGLDQYLPQVTDMEGFQGQITLVNTAGSDGGANRQTFVINQKGDSYSKSSDAFPIENFGSAHQQTSVDFTATYKETETPVWGKLEATGEAKFSSIQHFFDPVGEQKGFASMTPYRTPNRQVVFAGMGLPGWHKLVLVNTLSSPLPIDLELMNVWGQTQLVSIILQPYEKKVLPTDMNDDPLLFSNLDWVRITPYEGGFVGYQLHGNSKGALTASTGSTYATTEAILPYTPSSDELKTTLGLINSDDEKAVTCHVWGYTDSGTIIKAKALRLEPGLQVTYTTDELFGDQAASVTWTRAFAAAKTKLETFAYVSKRDKTAAAFMHGQGTKARDGRSFFGNFEFFEQVDLEGQGWYHQRFSDPGDSILYPIFDPNRSYWEEPTNGEFFIDNIRGPECGYFHLGYEPLYPTTIFDLIREPVNDSVTFSSGFFEVPENAKEKYLSFMMKFHDPETATPKSEFGLAWRIEGSNEWHWFGVTGNHLLDPPFIIADCWVPLQYRNELVTTTGWWFFEQELPEETLGKRIEVGMYYHFVVDDPRDPAPTMFFDNVEINVKKSRTGIFFEQNGHGRFTMEDGERIDKK